MARFRLAHVGELCWMCSMRTGIHPHHKQFKSQLGPDDWDNLVWLCGQCHDEAHDIRSTWYF
jgi:hypothetical protein